MMMLTKLCMDIVQKFSVWTTNCLKWHPMSTVSIDVPRIVHADVVKNRMVYVAGRGMHFVCGTSAVEDVHCQEFRLSRLPRRQFFMYPEEKFGPELNSASFMWEHVDGMYIFSNSSMHAYSPTRKQFRVFSHALCCVVISILEGCIIHYFYIVSFDNNLLLANWCRRLLVLLTR
jgi:hypothetical protein